MQFFEFASGQKPALKQKTVLVALAHAHEEEIPACSQLQGFLPEEREWLDSQLSPRTLVDVVRRLHPDVEGPYSWWSWLGGAYERDSGWRIDYHLATPRLARRAVSAVVDREHRGVRLSVHAPVVVDYDVESLLDG